MFQLNDKLNDKTKTLILFGIIVVVVILFYMNKENFELLTDTKKDIKDKKEEQKEEQKNNTQQTQNDNKSISTESSKSSKSSKSSNESENKQQNLVSGNELKPELYFDEVLSDNDPSRNVNILKKFRTRNSSKTGKFQSSNYIDGKREGDTTKLDKFFEEGGPLNSEKLGYTNSDSTSPIQYNLYVPGKQRKMKDVDKFNAESLHPQEKNKDWFDDPYESTSVKQSHLINIYRPIGVNTIQTTLKNPSHDIRGSPPNPKFAISPWMNSSYEPDTNLRNQSLCY